MRDRGLPPSRERAPRVSLTAVSFIAVHPVASFIFFIFRSRTKGRAGVATVWPVGTRATSPHIKVVAAVMQPRQLPRYLVTRSSMAFRGAENQDVQSHRESEQNNAYEQSLCPCHRCAPSFA